MHGEGHVEEHAHPSARKYVTIAVILAVITAAEVATYYLESAKSFLVPTLLVLATVKFALVAMFYMHLKFDSRLFSSLFVSGLLLAASVFIAVLALLHNLVPA